MANPARNEENAALLWRNIPTLTPSLQSPADFSEGLWSNNAALLHRLPATDSRRVRFKFACISVVEKRDQHEFAPSSSQLLKHPLALLALVPKDAALFAAGAVAGAAAKTVTAPLDRIKLIMQVCRVRFCEEAVSCFVCDYFCVLFGANDVVVFCFLVNACLFRIEFRFLLTSLIVYLSSFDMITEFHL